MTAYGTVNLAVEAMRQGAYDFIMKPFSNEEMLLHLERIKEQLNLVTENVALKREIQRHQPGQLIGKSAAMQRLYETIRTVAESDATVLIQGESGTGKELVAVAIHESSPRVKNPFVVVHCAVLTETLFESELFGHERGAFTGAIKERKGRFEQANGGTIFFDEVDDIPPTMQVKLLRVLQNHSLERVGGNQTIHVDVRVIAATKVELMECVQQGHFREDLFYRLNVVPIHIPPLRQRKEDIPLLVDGFIRKYDRHPEPRQIAPEALDTFMKYDWPGNVRELENTIERMVVLSHRDCLTLEDVPGNVRSSGHFAKSTSGSNRDEGLNLRHPTLNNLIHVDLNHATIPLETAVSDLECQLLLWALEKSEGNKSHAADLLHLRRTTFRDKLNKYGLDA